MTICRCNRFLKHERRRARFELGFELRRIRDVITRHDWRSSLNQSPIPRITRARISRVLLIILLVKLSRSHHSKSLSPVNDCGPYKLRKDNVFSWSFFFVPSKYHWHDDDIKRLIKSSVNRLTCVRDRY